MVEPSVEGCEVEVTGMPVSVMTHHRLAVADHEHPLASRVPLRVGPGGARVRVLGPRYHAERSISAQECTPGAVIRLEVEPLPARIDFPCAPRGMTVECVDCSPPLRERIYRPEDFPPLPMSSFSRAVELLLRAPGFHRQRRRVRLHPGPNRLHVELEPLAVQG
ncbi:MAG: hypothetical protein KDK70_43050 [Myxococcales bacterium]|nr:hypothetical protein [Myxococcales bacterium]